MKTHHSCFGCAIKIDPWFEFCKTCLLQIPRQLKNEHHTEWHYCKNAGIAHSDKLIEIRARMRKVFTDKKPVATPSLFESQTQ
jgi:hypothetical protein